MIRLLSMDLDDTLLRSDKTISPFTLDVLERCRERGILTAFNTARDEIHCASLIEQAKPDFVISSSGAMITRGGERVDVMPLTPAQTRRLIDLGRKENCPITVDTAGDLLLQRSGLRPALSRRLEPRDLFGFFRLSRTGAEDLSGIAQSGDRRADCRRSRLRLAGLCWRKLV